MKHPTADRVVIATRKADATDVPSVLMVLSDISFSKDAALALYKYLIANSHPCSPSSKYSQILKTESENTGIRPMGVIVWY